jgi:hypothetical protein
VVSSTNNKASILSFHVGFKVYKYKLDIRLYSTPFPDLNVDKTAKSATMDVDRCECSESPYAILVFIRTGRTPKFRIRD